MPIKIHLFSYNNLKAHFHNVLISLQYLTRQVLSLNSFLRYQNTDSVWARGLINKRKPSTNLRKFRKGIPPYTLTVLKAKQYRY
jgi:hypothetical protein